MAVCLTNAQDIIRSLKTGEWERKLETDVTYHFSIANATSSTSYTVSVLAQRSPIASFYFPHNRYNFLQRNRLAIRPQMPECECKLGPKTSGRAR